MKDNVAAVVVWYNPEADCARMNIESYISSVGVVCIVDNSDRPLSSDLKTYVTDNPKLIYVSLGSNLGIAYALNVGVRKIEEMGFSWFLTMDQDSQATPYMVEQLYNFALSEEIPNIGIVAAQPNTPTRAIKTRKGYSLMDVVITSGNLVYIQAYKTVGGFVDKLFIDYVDFVFCLAVREAGFAVIQVNNAILLHSLGHLTPKSFLGIKMFPTHHSPLRHYYIARNRLYLRQRFKKTFPNYIRKEWKNNRNMWIKTFLYEKNKWVSWKMAIQGRRDFRRGIFGKYQS